MSALSELIVLLLMVFGIQVQHVGCVTAPYGNSSTVAGNGIGNSSAGLYLVASNGGGSVSRTSWSIGAGGSGDIRGLSTGLGSSSSSLKELPPGVPRGLNGTQNATRSPSPPPIPSTNPRKSSTPTQTSLPQLSTNTTCLQTIYPSSHLVKWRTFADGICGAADAAYMNPDFYSYADKCLATWCVSSRRSALSAYTGPFTEYTTTPWSYFRWHATTFTVNGTRSKSWSVESTMSTEYSVRLKGAEDYVAYQAPCCGQCSMSVLSMHLIYWPDQATKTGGEGVGVGEVPRSVVDDRGFTFTSPSIYIAFTTLRAWDKCGSVGHNIDTTTLAFDLADISTYTGFYKTSCYNLTGIPYFTQLPTITASYHWLRTTRRLTISDLAQDCATTPGYYYNPEDPAQSLYDDDPCHPYIEVPAKIKVLHPDWSACIPAFGGGFYDPPKTLQEGGVLVPTATGQATPPIRPTPGQSIPDIPLPTGTFPEPTWGSNPVPAPAPVPNAPAPQPEPIRQPSSTTRDGDALVTVVLPGQPNFSASGIQLPTHAIPSNNPFIPLIPASPIIIPLQPALIQPTSQQQPQIQPTQEPENEDSITTITLQPTTISSTLALILDASRTITPGEAVTFSNHIISLESSGATLLIDRSTITLNIPIPTQVQLDAPSITHPPNFDDLLHDIIYTVFANGAVVLRGQTLRSGDDGITIGGGRVTGPDGVVSVEAETRVLLQGGSVVFVVGGKTIVPASETAKTQVRHTVSTITASVSGVGGGAAKVSARMCVVGVVLLIWLALL